MIGAMLGVNDAADEGRWWIMFGISLSVSCRDISVIGCAESAAECCEDGAWRSA